MYAACRTAPVRESMRAALRLIAHGTNSPMFSLIAGPFAVYVRMRQPENFRLRGAQPVALPAVRPRKKIAHDGFQRRAVSENIASHVLDRRGEEYVCKPRAVKCRRSDAPKPFGQQNFPQCAVLVTGKSPCRDDLGILVNLNEIRIGIVYFEQHKEGIVFRAEINGIPEDLRL